MWLRGQVTQIAAVLIAYLEKELSFKNVKSLMLSTDTMTNDEQEEP